MLRLMLPPEVSGAELAAAPAVEAEAVGIRSRPGPRAAALWLEARWLLEGRIVVGAVEPPAIGPVTGVGGGGGAAGISGYGGISGMGGGEGAWKHIITPLI